MNRHGLVPVKLYIQKLAVSWVWHLEPSLLTSDGDRDDQGCPVQLRRLCTAQRSLATVKGGCVHPEKEVPCTQRCHGDYWQPPIKLLSLTPETLAWGWGEALPSFLGGWEIEGVGKEGWVSHTRGSLFFTRRTIFTDSSSKSSSILSGRGGKNRVEILLGNGVMYHEHGLSGKQEK